MIFQSNIGEEFKTQMKNWFKEHPEIAYEWIDNELVIQNPNNRDRDVKFEINLRVIKIQNKDFQREYKQKLFENIEEQVFKIRGNMMNLFFKKEELRIIRPELKKHQFAVMMCNRNHGQVLTKNKNLFIGWGDVFQIFEDKEEYQKFINNESKDDAIEFVIYNSSYKFVEMK